MRGVKCPGIKPKVFAGAARNRIWETRMRDAA
jgi:hypothetical protein